MRRIWSRAAWVLMALVLLWAFDTRLDLIAARDVYPFHGDEHYLSGAAFKILKTGDLNPHFFNYGSLPIYLTAAAMRVGVLVSQLKGELTNLSEVTSVGFPYYSHADLVLLPRRLFALWSVLGMLGAAFWAHAAYQRKALLFLVPMVLSTCVLYTKNSWAYLNVDTIAGSIALVGTAYLISTQHATRFSQRVIWPAVFCGAATATKYNSAIIGLPFVVLILLGPRELRVRQLIGLFALSLVFFFVFEPFALFDFQTFKTDVLYEMRHYRTGHKGHDGEPGLPQLAFYVGVIVKDYQLWPCLMGLLGIGYGFVIARRSTWLALIFPVTMLLHMSTNRVHFPRTIQPVFALFSVFIALGLVALAELIAMALRTARKRISKTAEATPGQPPSAADRIFAGVGWIAVAALTLQPSYLQRLGDMYREEPESRVSMATWLRVNGTDHCMLLVPKQLAFDPRSLQGHCLVERLDMGDMQPNATPGIVKKCTSSKLKACYLIVPTWGFDPRHPNEQPVSKAWNEQLAALAPGPALYSAGSRDVVISQGAITHGSPKLQLFQLRR